MIRTPLAPAHLSKRSAAVIAACFCAVLAGPAGAGAATVANGDFEAGNLGGWSQVSTPDSGWFAYRGTNAPISTGGLPPEEGEIVLIPEEGEPTPRQVPAPPQGTFAAISDENGPSSHILYQDIALEPSMTHVLSMTAYYKSEAPIAVPSPDTLTVEEQKGGAMVVEPIEEEGELPPPEPDNQQFRIDVIKPGAPIATLNPSDILKTVFRTNPGDAQEMAPTVFSVDLSAFAGQTVRLRIADVDNVFFMNSGVDDVSVQSVPVNTFSLGKKLKLNKKKGTAKLAVTVPNPGIVKAVDVRAARGKAAQGKASTSKRKPARLRPAKVTAKRAGKLFLKLRPTRSGKKALKTRHRLPFKVKVTYTPTGGSAASHTFKGTLKLR